MPVAARSKAWACGRSLAGIACSNGMDVFIWSVVCCQIEVSAPGWSLVQNNPTKCGVSECDREASIRRRPWPTRGCCAMKKFVISNGRVCRNESIVTSVNLELVSFWSAHQPMHTLKLFTLKLLTMLRHVSIIRSSSGSCLFLAKITLLKTFTAWFSYNNFLMWQWMFLIM